MEYLLHRGPSGVPSADALCGNWSQSMLCIFFLGQCIDRSINFRFEWDHLNDLHHNVYKHCI